MDDKRHWPLLVTKVYYRHGGKVVERSHRMWEIEVRSPVKTGSDSSTAKRSVTGVSAMGLRR